MSHGAINDKSNTKYAPDKDNGDGSGAAEDGGSAEAGPSRYRTSTSASCTDAALAAPPAPPPVTNTATKILDELALKAQMGVANDSDAAPS